MRQYKAYKEADFYVLESKNDFGTVFVSRFESKQAFDDAVSAARNLQQITDDNFVDLTDRVGRPSLGQTKKVSLTLPSDFWEVLDVYKNEKGFSSQSETFRNILEDYFLLKR